MTNTDRSDQLMDHLDDRQSRGTEDWDWYDRYIVDFIRNDLGMADEFTEDQVSRTRGGVLRSGKSGRTHHPNRPHPSRLSKC